MWATDGRLRRDSTLGEGYRRRPLSTVTDISPEGNVVLCSFLKMPASALCADCPRFPAARIYADRLSLRCIFPANNSENNGARPSRGRLDRPATRFGTCSFPVITGGTGGRTRPARSETGMLPRDDDHGSTAMPYPTHLIP